MLPTLQKTSPGFVRSFRIDCLKSAIIDFITKEIGGKFVDPPTFDIAKSYSDSVNTTPLIFILSPGTDPVSDVIRFAEQVGMAKKFEPISLGQGQGPRAQSLIDRARQTGGWVLLSNCHLMQSWMPTLEAIVEQLDPETMSNNFRLWLTSMPAKSFPVQVLQNGVKMTNEPPSGLRANLLRSYTTVSDRLFEESNKPSVFKTLLFGFCFFHAVVQEGEVVVGTSAVIFADVAGCEDRRKFGPIGWNIPYGFTPEDLAVCRQQLMLFVNKYKDVPYKVLNFLGAQINYGGRVTDDKDKLLISTILATFICPEAVNQKDQYKYSSSGIYFAPGAENVEEFVEYIRSLPLYPMPEAFGLHDNCNITCAQEEAFKLLLGMQSMVSAGGGGGDGKSADDVMDATAASIQDKLPKPFALDVCELKFPTQYEESMNTVVKQECLRYNKLLWTMDSSLKAFRKAIKGLIVMTAELEELGKSIFVNEVPEMWLQPHSIRADPAMIRWLIFVGLLFAVRAQPSPRRRSPPPSPPRRRSFDDRRRSFDDRRRSFDDRRRSFDDRRRSPYVPPAPPPPPPPPDPSMKPRPDWCSSCESGYTKSDLLGKKCDACGANCNRCDTAGAGKCDINGCKDQYIMVKGICKACSSYCLSCSSSGPADCDKGKCFKGYGNWRNGTGCGACTSHCSTCSIAGAGDCDAGECDRRYTYDKGNCSPCGPFCTSCNAAGPGKCDTCDATYFATKNFTCERCVENCRTCFSATDEGCTSCIAGYVFGGKNKRECQRETDPMDLSWIIGGVLTVFCLLGAIFFVACPLCRQRSRARDALLSHQQMAVRTPSLTPTLPVQPIWSVPSGSWRGYYTYGGRNHDVCEFELRFDNGIVKGRGVDDVGAYTIRGKFDGRRHSIDFTKQYQRGTRNQSGRLTEDNEGHAVVYAGRLVGEHLGAGFRGSWKIRNQGTNSDGRFHLWPAMDSWASASAPPEEPTPQVFQVAEDGECVVCLDRHISTCLRPCGHIAMCSQCADRLKRSTGSCPICRSQIQSVLVMRDGEVFPDAAQALR
eukprot:symbB.v1.2.000850.t2/scaffold37.1/size397765/22